MTEDQIFEHIDKAIKRIEIVKAVMALKRLEPNRLDSFYGEFGLEDKLSQALQELLKSQKDRIPF